MYDFVDYMFHLIDRAVYLCPSLRIIAKAPYQINPAATTSKPGESEFSWLGLAAPSTTH
jgi:hypothetical protein